MKQQWHPVVYFHKEVLFPPFTNFQLPSEFFSFLQQVLREPFLLLPQHTHQNSYYTPTGTSTRDQCAQTQAASFLKGCISYLHGQKFTIVTKKLQDWYKHIFKFFSRKQRIFFSWCPQECSKYCSVPFVSSIPLPILFLSKAICSFFSHLMTLRFFHFMISK